MTLFWLAGAALAAVVLGLVLRPLIFRGSKSSVSRPEANLSSSRSWSR